ncbi:MAG TPA: ATP-binding protein, partial [Thermomicrobiaceae bacterium]|nr:ATP-binding protein [Thermomicrobiaceae bacterium]
MGGWEMSRPGPQEILVGSGEMAARIQEYDWSRTPLGPIASWPQSLVTAVNLILDAHYPMLIEWGPEFIQIYNDAYRPVLGATKHPGGLGQPARECWPEIWDYIGPLFEQALREGEATWEEDQLFVLDRNGYVEETYFTFCYSAIRDETHDPGGVLVTCIETTGRVLGERRLRTLRELAAHAAAAVSVEEAYAAVAATLAGNPYDVPFALLYLLDGPRARLVGASGLAPGGVAAPTELDVTPGTPSDGVSPDPGWPLAEVARTGRAVVFDDVLACFGVLPGSPWPEPPTQAVVLPIDQPGDSRPAALLVAGVSPRRALDDDYRVFLDLAASHIATAIGNARAHEAERQRAEALAELDRAKTEFFSNVSHEFRTPLTLLLGPLQDALAEGSSLPAAERERLAIANRNAQRLLKLVNSLLDFARIEAGRIDAVYEPTDLASLTRDLASAFRSAIERAGLRFTVTCPALAEPVYVDHEMWEKIVLNLLSNAFKFTFQGEIAVSLEADGDRAVLVVRDSGVGIAADELPHVFERFRRVRAGRARTQEGTGIGLALVQELVRLHGGTIEVESEVGRGTTFRVAIPTGSAHLPADRVGAAHGRASTAAGTEPFVEEALRWLPDGEADRDGDASRSPAPDAGRTPDLEQDGEPTLADVSLAGLDRRDAPRVLVVDDNADMRSYLAQLLGAHWSVETVPDGEAALRAARRRPPDLVLTDVMMPRLDGFGLLRALRAGPRTRAIPVILLSARAGEEATVEGIEAGADDYLVKPFTARELVARVRTHLELARTRREIAVAHRRASFLAEASRILASSLDYHATLRAIARLAVPALADWCTVDLVDAEGHVRRVAGAAADRAREPLLDEVSDRYPVEWLSAAPSARVLVRGEPELIPEVTEATIARRARDAEHVRLLRELAATSFMALPLVAHDRRLGVLSLATAESGRRYGPEDLAVAQDLANRCALALDNARLYRDSREEADAQTQLSAALQELAATRERVLELVTQERQLLRTVFEQSPAFIATLRGPSHIFEFVNPPYLRVVGRRREELIGRSVRDVLPEIDGQGYFELLDRVFTTGEPFVGNELLVRLDRSGSGELEDAFLNFVYFPLRDADGAVDGIVAFGVDVTEQVRARQVIEAAARQRD